MFVGKYLLASWYITFNACKSRKINERKKGIELLEFSICNFKGIVIGKMVVFLEFSKYAECIQMS